MHSAFKSVAGLRPNRNVFDLSYRHNFTCDMGQLVPCFLQEAVPGDHFKIANEVLVRFQPLNAPVMHEISASVHYFFVPYRLLSLLPGAMFDRSPSYNSSGQRVVDRDIGTLKSPFERFISNDWGALGDISHPPIQMPFVGSNGTQLSTPDGADDTSGAALRRGSLWDYFGFPLQELVGFGVDTVGRPTIKGPLMWPWLAYNYIYNEYYRDQDLQVSVAVTNGFVLNRNWKKDYFTCARPFRQKGLAPALPVNVDLQFLSGLPQSYMPPASPGTWPALSSMLGSDVRKFLRPVMAVNQSTFTPSTSNNSSVQIVGGVAGIADSVLGGSASNGDIRTAPFLQFPSDSGNTNTGIVGNSLVVDSRSIVNSDVISAKATTFNVSDLRLAFQTQKWLERNARAGTRYTEFLQSHFGVSPHDSRLDRPEYIGGTKQPVIISEVLQTSETTEQSPQAAMRGHGLSATGSFAGSYNVQEYGLIMGILSVMPKPSYQDGINRQWMRSLPIDYYFPEFAHLSEQAIRQSEICLTANQQSNDTIFGYTGQYDEMRVNHDIVSSEMRNAFNPDNPDQPVFPDLSFWNLSRKFDPTLPPALNSQFITCVPDKRIFAVTNYPGLMVNVQNIIRATRPLPAIAEPGLVDHF